MLESRSEGPGETEALSAEDRRRLGPAVRRGYRNLDDIPAGEVWSALDRIHTVPGDSDDGESHNGPQPMIARTWLDDGEPVTVAYCPGCGRACTVDLDDVPVEHWTRVEDVLGAEPPG